MAHIAPFRGLNYHPDLVPEMGNLVGPPFDPVTAKDQDRYRNLHPKNIINMLYFSGGYGQSCQDTADVLDEWLKEEILVRSQSPAIYLYQVDYYTTDTPLLLTRTGFISLVRLQNYKTGIVRPHEQTFSGVKQDRLEMLARCQASLSQVMTFYDDADNAVITTLASAADHAPDLNFRDSDGLNHRLWRVTDPRAHLKAAQQMESKSIFIADGHHRYETSLAHRNAMRLAHPHAGPLAAFNYSLLYLSPIQDPGLKILPSHRLIPELPGFDETAFLESMAKYFEITDTGLNPDSADERVLFKEKLSERAGRTKTIGFLAAESGTLRLASVKPELLHGLQVHPALKDLDVVSLEEFVFRRCLGLNKAARDDERMFAFFTDQEAAIKRVASGKARLGFLLNPTRVSQVKEVADAGLTMPRKSTMFYPKVTTGLAMTLIPPDEEAADPLDYWGVDC